MVLYLKDYGNGWDTLAKGKNLTYLLKEDATRKANAEQRFAPADWSVRARKRGNAWCIRATREKSFYRLPGYRPLS